MFVRLHFYQLFVYILSACYCLLIVWVYFVSWILATKKSIKKQIPPDLSFVGPRLDTWRSKSFIIITILGSPGGFEWWQVCDAVDRVTPLQTLPRGSLRTLPQTPLFEWPPMPRRGHLWSVEKAFGENRQTSSCLPRPRPFSLWRQHWHHWRKRYILKLTYYSDSIQLLKARTQVSRGSTFLFFLVVVLVWHFSQIGIILNLLNKKKNSLNSRFYIFVYSCCCSCLAIFSNWNEKIFTNQIKN